MVSEQGIVEKVSKTKAVVRVTRHSACAGCHSKGACMPSESKDVVMEALNELHAQVGDYVQVSVPAGSLLKVSFLVYFVPVVALVCGAIVGNVWAAAWHMDPTLAAILCGGLAMGVTFCAVKWFDRAADLKAQYWPRITRILPMTDVLPPACSK